MCNIITYIFTCTHTLPHRRSACHGTKHARTRPTCIKAACSAAPSLALHLRVACAACLHAAFETAWARKLALARTFLQDLQKRGICGGGGGGGVRHVEHLVRGLEQQLEQRYDEEAWQTRLRFPPAWGGEERVRRVQMGGVAMRASGLRREVHVSEAGVWSEERSWWDMQAGDYEGDYVGASTDALRPVCAEYEALWGGEAEGGEEECGGDGLEVGEWAWSGEHEGCQEGMRREEQDANDSRCYTSDIRHQPVPHGGMIAYGPDSGRTSKSIFVNMLSTSESQYEERANIDRIIEEFWRTVNADEHTTEGHVQPDTTIMKSS